MTLFNQTVTSMPADTTLNFNPEEALKRLEEGPRSSVSIFNENGFIKSPFEIEQEITIENSKLQGKIQKKEQELKEQITELLKDMKLSGLDKTFLEQYLMGTLPSYLNPILDFMDPKIVTALEEETEKLREEIKNLKETLKANNEQYPDDIWHGPHRLDDDTKPKPLPWTGEDVQWKPYKN